MIYTITFNPALDVSGVVDELIPDEKSYVHDEKRTPGGNGINAGIVASRLGSGVRFSGFLGGPNGQVIKGLLDKEKLKSKFIRIKNETRMNITVSNKKTHRQTRLSFSGPVIHKNEWKQLIQLINGLRPERDIIILGGSLPPGIIASDISVLIKGIKRKGIFCMVDMPGRILKELISARPDFIKPNLEEFNELISGKAQTITEVMKEVKKLHKHVPLVCVSSVEGGTILADKNGALFGKAPRLKIYSTVGAGDSMVGAMGSLLAKNTSSTLSELLTLGLAASCATLTEPGLTLGTRERILKYKSKVIIKEI